MISRAPSFASSDSTSRGSRPPPGKQPIDLLLELRRRRYRTFTAQASFNRP
jgi:hypothetical protein